MNKKVFILVALLSAGSCRSEFVPLPTDAYGPTTVEGQVAAEAARQILQNEQVQEATRRFSEEMQKPERQEVVKEIFKKALQGLVVIFGGQY